MSDGVRKTKKCGRSQRQKGDRVERAVVVMHEDAGIHAERVPLSGASHYQGRNADVDIYARGRDAAPFCAEVKARKNGEGFRQIEAWLGNNDALFLHRDRAAPLVVLPFARWIELCGGGVKWRG